MGMNGSLEGRAREVHEAIAAELLRQQAGLNGLREVDFVEILVRINRDDDHVTEVRSNYQVWRGTRRIK